MAFALAAAAQARARRGRRRAKAGRAPVMASQPAAVSPSQREGDAAQALALRYLERAGLACLATNVRCRAGELDLVMRDGEVLVFVEVRARASARFGGAAASVGRPKQRRLVQAARVFLHTQWRGPLPRCRFDVVAIDAGVLTWLRDAFAGGL